MMILGIVIAAVVIAAFALAVVLHYRKESKTDRIMRKINEAAAEVYRQRIEDQVDYD